MNASGTICASKRKQHKQCMVEIDVATIFASKTQTTTCDTLEHRPKPHFEVQTQRFCVLHVVGTIVAPNSK
jgi:hypothetical protein